MLTIIATGLTVLWLVALATAHTFGGAVHLLIVIAAVVVLERVIQAGPGLRKRHT